MDSNRLKLLEKRYWAGESSLDEEHELKEAVRNDADGVSFELVSLFQEIAQNKDQILDADFDSDFWQKANNEKGKGGARIFTLSLFMRYAAVGIILFGITFALWNIVLKDEPVEAIAQTEMTTGDTYNDPQVAFEETKRALLFASEKLNKGKEPIKEIKRFYNAKVSIAGMQTDSMNTKKKTK
ncbi:hypothetical protein G3O08_19875 [Cryomorpha ignava]|uniref:Uncharacterized protein n=1 Tax=Cryomorpha ignava TaxID=101383 RepID=A0A7K3WVT9_9FLAO|nr:hypothetical protein [Cryomorpha ignava]NEN25753.1 hypothetical protein [Cryomorpha ignava]